jgi:hypothetical protein
MTKSVMSRIASEINAHTQIQRHDLQTSWSREAKIFANWDQAYVQNYLSIKGWAAAQLVEGTELHFGSIPDGVFEIFN